MMLIADSGSTNTGWRFVQENGDISQFKTIGLNPMVVSYETIKSVINKEIIPEINSVKEVFFYGAGCAGFEGKEKLSAVLQELFPEANIQVESDMLAAARACCGSEEGIVAIMGTGSNSCYYDGKEIVFNRPSLGYVLGDEGAGYDIGKRLVKAFLYGEMPENIANRFAKKTGLTKEILIDEVYRGEFPNRYLASYSKLAYQMIKEPFVLQLVTDSLNSFIETHLLKYPKSKEVPVSFVGSVAFYYSNLLRRLCEAKSMRLGNILENPIAALTLYHIEH